ncbi:BrnA antitoxin family protein [Paraburkholderia nemoris]|nr:BrnA antitoxin family protein [Paraburkholderia nemoris]
MLDICFYTQRSHSNEAAYGIPLDHVYRFDWESMVATRRTGINYGGYDCYIAFGTLEGIAHVMVYANRPDGLWVVSLRRASTVEFANLPDMIQSNLKIDAHGLLDRVPVAADAYTTVLTVGEAQLMRSIHEILPRPINKQMIEEVAKRGRPFATQKVPVKIKVDPDVLAAYRLTGSGWTTRMNRALREWAISQDML